MGERTQGSWGHIPLQGAAGESPQAARQRKVSASLARHMRDTGGDTSLPVSKILPNPGLETPLSRGGRISLRCKVQKINHFKPNDSVALRPFTVLGNHHLCLGSKLFRHRKETLDPLSSYSHSSLLPVPGSP